MNIILLLFLVSIGINLIMFVPAYIKKTDKLTDISYAITFITVALFGYIVSSKTLAHFIGFLLVVLWAIRLGAFLFIRINRMKKDVRFDGMRERFFAFMGFWLLQGLTVFVVLIPLIMLWSTDNTKLDWISVAGISIFTLGLLLETVADYQKNKFRELGKKTWIDTGVWRASRHPNYLGEISLWIGVYLFVFPSLNLADQLIALVGPAYIASLIIFVSGIKLLERSSDKKWGDQTDYIKYKTEVPVLTPTLSSVKRLFN